MSLNRREFLHVMSMAAAAGMLPGTASAMSGGADKAAIAKASDEIYNQPMKGKVRLLHITDTHAQLKPIYFREPNVNLGTGPAFGKLPHVVGTKLLKEIGVEENTPLAHAFSYLNFQDASMQYGKVGGFAHVKTLLDKLREQAGGQNNTLTMDGGDLWHGSGTALFTRGMDMVEASNLLGVDIMTGHWEFTYKAEEVLKNLNAFKGEFLAQNVRIKEDSLFGDEYREMVDRNQGTGLYDEDEARAFKPYTVKIVNGERIAVVGQAFPRTANANPQSNFPDWSFGLREDALQELVDKIREKEKVAAIVMISHNGMDVDIKMASRISGIDAIFGGHTHDGIAKTTPVKTPEGGVCHVTNAGSNGKFVGVMDLDIVKGKLKGVDYKLLPVFSNVLAADAEVQTFIDHLYTKKYDENVIESRNPDRYVNKDRLGKTYGEILNEELAVAEDTLYRRGNFMGTWDQIIVNSLREEHDTQIAMSAGVRWGTSVLAGEMITMERVMDETSMTYGETYKSEVTGAAMKDILEGICENLFQKDPYLQSGGDMVRLGGMDYTCEPNGKFGSRISDMRLDDGTPLEANKTYTVSGWAQVEAVGQGRLMWDVAADYLRNNKGSTKLQKVNHPKLKGVKNNPGIESYPGEMS
ncbi:5'-nucleotidase C-terminal domain-containing protein [Thiomicrorhabdus lithotrophica]|uniref:5'-nucleotidase C-terminal domain-containing protein n=1 Tax=Thiomicrorhabdus lithotrophica TaxID=2949997 RepID=A0ABY8C736_9GAMM|nr:5'-nucleotidase C-terminal domain-containing protein [Thiomicrorhabdus lithotrophica]WEJ61760.1 5'-nucleotidase C-terminal domain-containing protein [Thiomicrorhabdus lithotrophica]